MKDMIHHKYICQKGRQYAILDKNNMILKINIINYEKQPMADLNSGSKVHQPNALFTEPQ